MQRNVCIAIYNHSIYGEPNNYPNSDWSCFRAEHTPLEFLTSLESPIKALNTIRLQPSQLFRIMISENDNGSIRPTAKLMLAASHGKRSFLFSAARKNKPSLCVQSPISVSNSEVFFVSDAQIRKRYKSR